ncbi:MAG: acyl-CoA dehydratase activase [Desulfarculaceae bacterium]|nr:acyl-CoA dehydratase activase [Desulfarculaceae bacterium]
MITAGIDIGSTTAKGAILKDGHIEAVTVMSTGYDPKGAAETVFQTLLEKAGLDRKDLEAVVSTGYGRKNVGFAGRSVTEITCHAAGARLLSPTAATIVDIGGQDSKVIVLDSTGKVADFTMNDKCAAGTGRFLEVMASALQIDLASLAEFSARADATVAISSVCTVFAESEVISLISKGEKRENIIAGIHAAIGSRIVSMAGRVKARPPYIMTGGVALNRGVVRVLEERFQSDVTVPELAQVNGAVGAALIAADRNG